MKEIRKHGIARAEKLLKGVRSMLTKTAPSKWLLPAHSHDLPVVPDASGAAASGLVFIPSGASHQNTTSLCRGHLAVALSGHDGSFHLSHDPLVFPAPALGILLGTHWAFVTRAPLLGMGLDGNLLARHLDHLRRLSRALQWGRRMERRRSTIWRWPDSGSFWSPWSRSFLQSAASTMERDEKR